MMNGQDSDRRKWTVTGIAGRSAEVVRSEGVKSLWFRILGELVYRRLVLFSCRQERLPPGLPGSAGLTLATIADSERDAYERFRGGGIDCRRLLQSGKRCWVLRSGSEIVSSCWTATDFAEIPYLGLRIRLAPGQVYLFDTYTAPACRGRSHASRLVAELARTCLQQGERAVISAVLPENRGGMTLFGRLGFRQAGVVGYFGIGPWRREFCRSAIEPDEPGGKRFPRLADGKTG
ncbi:MAG: GNAT family N-acetyltransferase [Desulfobulbaceae bacterium]|nr:MAG: GNAT family N-acetyltransferase [Desulfobulbaceae bacterium]